MSFRSITEINAKNSGLVWYHQFFDKKEFCGGHGLRVVLFVGLLSSFVFIVFSRMENGGGEGGKNSDFYQVLGLNKDCTATELRNAYKKLALRWHPDRFPASGNSKFVDEAKKKFQAIQQAYSVLSDTNKRFLYDVGVYDSDDDETGMGGFMNEMAAMMSQTKPLENVEESFEELQELFDEMFQADLDSFGIGCQATTCVPYSESTNSNNKRVSADMNLGKTKVDDSSGFISQVEKFCLGTGGTPAVFQEGEGSKRRSSRRNRR